MAYILGIDTGGTYTDAVIIDPARRHVCDKAKSFTTKQALEKGIGESVAQLDASCLAEVTMVCLSTTLATNSVVEGRSGRVGALLLGRKPEGELPAAQLAVVRGELDIKGRQLVPVDTDEVRRVVEQWRGKVDAIAISGFACVRNPAHELAVKRTVAQALSVPVVCAHELSQTLGFYDRTVTAVLNAGLIPCITELIEATRAVLHKAGLDDVPIMMVKGDGSLMQCACALDRPIETVLSGPAASIVGGLFLTGEQNALVLDMGGTTTDIAYIKDGGVQINAAGAQVGGWRTQLKAAALFTAGVGGDSRLWFDAQGELCVGPQRVLPLCVAAMRNPALAQELTTFAAAGAYELFTEQIAECYMVLRRPKEDVLTPQDEQLLALLEGTAHSLFWLAQHMGRDAEKLGLDRLVRLGVLQRCGLTPTDLLHADGTFVRWDTAAAEAGLRLMARRAKQEWDRFLANARQAVEHKLAATCIQAMLDMGAPERELPSAAAFLLHRLTDDTAKGPMQLAVSVDTPVIALGAPVAAWLPQICDLLNAELVIPPHAEVANAVGAAVGQVSAEAAAVIRPDQYHKQFVIHATWGMTACDTLEQAEELAVRQAIDYAAGQARAAGSHRFEVAHTVRPVYTEAVQGEARTFIETRVRAVAVGSPIWSENGEQ